MNKSPFHAALLAVLIPVGCALAQNTNGMASANYSTTASIGATATFVPLDSWVYPALRRLADLGYIPSQTTDMMPYTRAECRRQIEQAASLLDSPNPPGDAGARSAATSLLNDLEKEFPADVSDHENAITLESVYTNFVGIAGTPLRDSYHFGQTIVNDYGRQYDSGLNNQTGASAYASWGRFFVYARGEYQYAPGRAAYPLSVRQFIATADENPLLGPTPFPATNHFDFLEAYAGVQLGFENITFGKESLWWGPGSDSAYSFSNNAEPFYMLNFNQSRPIVLPGFLHYLGQIKTDFIFGELSGHHWPSHPQVNAQKVTFDLTPNFEVGFTRSAFWGGQGHPETVGAFFNSIFSTSSTGTTFRYGDRSDPGDRHSGFDFRYRVPGLRRYLTIYSDSYSDDDPSPLDNPRRAAWGPGMYISHLPHIAGLDLRFETYSTWTYTEDRGGNFIYWNNQYHDSYTNDGFLLGSWVGRDARAYDATVGYWLTARTRVQAQYRDLKQGPRYLPGGGSQSDFEVTANWGLSSELLVSGMAQIERYDIPILALHKDGVIGVSLTYTPHNATLQ